MDSLVYFNSKEAADLAVERLNDQDLEGRKVHVRLDRSDSSTSTVDSGLDVFKVYVGNISWSLANEDLLEYFTSFNATSATIATNMRGKSRGFAILCFFSESDAQQAIAEKNNSEFGGRKIQVSYLLYL